MYDKLTEVASNRSVHGGAEFLGMGEVGGW